MTDDYLFWNTNSSYNNNSDYSSDSEDDFYFKLPVTYPIRNIKYLKNFILESKQKIKTINKVITRLNTIIKNSNDEIDKINKKLSKRSKSSFNKINGICEKCAEITNSQQNLKKHKCDDNWFGISRDEITLNLIRNIKDLNRIIKKNSIILNQKEQKKEYLNNKIKSSQEIIKEESMVCQKCKKKTDCLEEYSCSYNHILCSNCINDDDKCPICYEILNLEICPICMERKKYIIDINCGNNHKICKKCTNTIIKMKPQCPFCRKKINFSNLHYQYIKNL